MIIIHLNAECQLFLSRSEVIALANDLEAELIGIADSEVVIADVPLIKVDGWKLLDKLRNAVESVNWRVDGF